MDPGVRESFVRLLRAAVAFTRINRRFAMLELQGDKPDLIELGARPRFRDEFQTALERFRKVYPDCPRDLLAAEVCHGLK